MAIVKPTPEEIAEREEIKRFRNQNAEGVYLDISISVARQHGYYPAILLAYLTQLHWEYVNYGDSLNTREKKKWIPARSYKQLALDQPLFPDTKTVRLAAQELEQAGYILTESTGKFLEMDHRTGKREGKFGRKRDLATWWLVVRPNLPDTFRVLVSEAQAHKMPVALILAYWRNQPEIEEGYRKLSAVELEKALPMDERTARRQLEKMLVAGVLESHTTKAKLYKLGTGSKPAVEPQKQPQPVPETVDEVERAHAAKLRARYAKQ